MPEVRISVDTKQVERLGFDFRRMAVTLGDRVTKRGEQLLREEVPKVLGNLRRGVSSDFNEQRLEGKLSVAARAGRRESQGGLLHLPGGETREIRLRSRPAFDYAEAVARGTGVYKSGDGFIGPRGVIRPKSGRALLVPIDAVPVKNGRQEAYITSGGQKYIVRRFIKGRRPNPYDVRAADRLEKEIPGIADAAVNEFINEPPTFN